MKTLIMIAALILVAGCSSQPKSNSTPEAELPKASPPPGGGTRMYEGAAPTAIEASPSKSVPVVTEKRSCDTPLGTIPDGGKATGWLKPTVPPDEICISDTLTCKDGTWSGQAIYPTCKKEKAK
ncbi:hypothetical protein [Bdellovibrio bacteriovorus]|uniref:hypothetical protein n=1 Tax=Bdellovibrio bacteriovorus TaxID=959 RepID=UPI003A7FB8F7